MAHSTLRTEATRVWGMTKTADVNEVAVHFSEWLREVAAGHEVLVTENGRPVARVLGAGAGRENARPRPVLTDLPTLPGHWAGEPVIKGETLADELLDRE